MKDLLCLLFGLFVLSHTPAQQPIINKKPVIKLGKPAIQKDYRQRLKDVLYRFSSKPKRQDRRNVNVITLDKYKIGDYGQGGIVFWIDETGVHGLVASLYDQYSIDSVIKWKQQAEKNRQEEYNRYLDSCCKNEINKEECRAAIMALESSSQQVGKGILNWPFPGLENLYGEANSIEETNNAFASSTRDGIYAGMYNTNILAQSKYQAALICTLYDGGGYGDWYLPSGYELDLMFNKRTQVGLFSKSDYLSSTFDIGSSFVKTLSFTTGLVNRYEADSCLQRCSIRAIRAF